MRLWCGGERRQLHHGKTMFMDMLVQQTHPRSWDPNREHKYTDTRMDETVRATARLLATLTALALCRRAASASRRCPCRSCSHRRLARTTSSTASVRHARQETGLLWLTHPRRADTPGHVNFSDEQTAAIRLADGAVIVVDAVEGVVMQTERSIKHAVDNKLPLVLLINKVRVCIGSSVCSPCPLPAQLDRLILELKIPPTDAYHKLAHTIEEVNGILLKCGHDTMLSPEKGNVLFASNIGGWVFSLQSFAKMYADYHQNFPAEELAKRLWGDVFFNPATRKFHRKQEKGDKSVPAASRALWGRY
jgi:U5 small nuclear ribonucleoprotein component